MSEAMELVLVDAQNAVQIFTGGGLDAVLDGIEAKVRAIPLDPSTPSGREEIRSVAYRVARTKTTLDAEGKKLTEGWRKATAKVNEERKRSLERLDALADEIRKPLTDFENKERIRVEAHEEALRDITGLHAMIAAHPDMSLDLLVDHQRDLANMLPGYQWEEFSHRAQAARSEAEKYIAARLEARKKFEVEREELARLRKDEAERLQRERDEKIKADAAEKAREQAKREAKEAADTEAKRVIEAATAERKRVEAEAERVRLENERSQREAEAARKREEDAKLAAEKRAIAAEKKAAEDLKAAKEKAAREAEAAAQRERDKIEKERKAKEAAESKRKADEDHISRIREEITDDLYSHGMFDPEYPDRLRAAVDSIMEGKIRHIKVVY